ncbi:glutathione S-transferase family protein [Phreatobacter stygius]|uniref:Glutathione S-transferase family protein n=2 Tax=Phreatobacter stygius TaxID=1940610 RepID=A0A4D7B8I3_9HYPH|nr:glutathione S-transferase family protein [Phreatobacter stygius]
MRLFYGPLNMFGAKVQIAAFEKGLDFEIVMVPFDMDRLYEPKHPEVCRINPKRQVPVLIHDDLEIFDSTQIFEYFEHLKPEPALWPAEPAARARARLIEHKSDEVYFPHIIRLMSLQGQLGEEPAIAALESAGRFHAEMERTIGANDYLSGAYSFADIAFFMAQLFGERMGARLTDAHPKLVAWRERMTRRPAVRKVAGPMVAYLVSVGRSIPPFLADLKPQGEAAPTAP